MRNFVFYQKQSTNGTASGQASTIKESMEQNKFNVQRMSGSTEIIREMEVAGLANFTAYANHAIKVHFNDRTILRMQKGQDVVKILSARGEEFVFNISSIARNQIAQRQFQNYVQVAMEFFDWVFLTKEEQDERIIRETEQKEAIQTELDKIQRSLNYIAVEEKQTVEEVQISQEVQEQTDVYAQVAQSTV